MADEAEKTETEEIAAAAEEVEAAGDDVQAHAEDGTENYTDTNFGCSESF
jgi:hypothetical protein